MDSETAQLERQLEEARKLREEAERQADEAKRRADEAEQRIQPNSLFGLLEGCHTLSQAIQVKSNARLTTYGDYTNPTNRLLPHHVRLWEDFPRLQEEVWEKINSDPSFPFERHFASNHYLTYPLRFGPWTYSSAPLQEFQQDIVDHFVSRIISALRKNEALSSKLHLQGRGRRRIHGLEFCVHVVDSERQRPIFAVEFKSPQRLTLADLISGLHEMDIARDVFGKEIESFEFRATYLVAALITQIFSYMVDSGVQYGEIITGGASIFLHIPEDPTTVLYFLSVPNQDVGMDERYNLHRTAVGQKLAFTLNAIAAAPPTHEWHDTALEKLSTWEGKYTNVLRSAISESIWKAPPTSEYKPLSWGPIKRSPYNTQSRTICQPNRTTPDRTSKEGSENRNDSGPPKEQPGCAREERGSCHETPSTRAVTREYCTPKCIRGLLEQGPLDPACPNVEAHGCGTHSLSASEFTCRLHDQLIHDRHEGFEQLHIRGRIGFMLKASLLSHGYTVILKAVTARREANIKKEAQVYNRLRSLQGYQIPVFVGQFKPRSTYWYHGELMARMMILSWSGLRISTIRDKENTPFFETEREKLLKVLRSHGMVHGDSEWRNVLWNESASCAVMIDFEDVTWLEKKGGAPVKD
ncbi:hypothetical protein BO78DRAFT_367384 [Aspergillus sclerotiicarbonarius CBS 121057]|uniref:Aminoglycoside phosphotransferase domain-containing protein n=1 Tax=Aspergillus sclerotiicarbonarius (strain CBS 121057 / IBT 28362) TaxID=1448318 RepID=A0A319EHD2_ASPSB|nr:hypothetical protein BO78DRAFT_367384 [Aspergillus sclerotiicarbonarius CBS 121057]